MYARKRTENTSESAEIRCLKAAVSSAFAIRERDLRARSRSRARTAFARQVAMYLAHVGFGLTLDAVGEAFGRDRTTASHACRLVEDRRDDRTLDYLIDRLEAATRLWAHATEWAGAPDHGR